MTNKNKRERRGDDKAKIAKYEKAIREKQAAQEWIDPKFFGDVFKKMFRYNLGPNGMGKPVALEVKEALYQLYTRDKDFWNPHRLAAKFGLPVQLTSVIIMSKKVEKQLMKKPEVHKDLLDDTLEKAMMEEFGMYNTSKWEPRGFVPSDITTIEDNIDLAVMERVDKKFSKPPPPQELPEKPVQLYPPPRVIVPAQRANKLRKHKIAYVDWVQIKKKGPRTRLAKVPDEEKFIMIQDVDGSFRTPSWEERKFLTDRLASRPLKKNKLPKHLTQTEAIEKFWKGGYQYQQRLPPTLSQEKML
jgi:hypothetical protein